MATPTINDVADEVDDVLSTFASSYDPDDISGSWNLGDPPPLGLDAIDIAEVVDYLNSYLKDNGAPHQIDPATEVKPSMTVGALIKLAFSKFKP